MMELKLATQNDGSSAFDSVNRMSKISETSSTDRESVSSSDAGGLRRLRTPSPRASCRFGEAEPADTFSPASVWRDEALIADIMLALEAQGVPENDRAAMCSTLLRIVEQERSFGARRGRQSARNHARSM